MTNEEYKTRIAELQWDLQEFLNSMGAKVDVWDVSPVPVPFMTREVLQPYMEKVAKARAQQGKPSEA